MLAKYHGNPIQVTKNMNNMLNTRTPNTNQWVTFNPALILRHEHHTIKFARPYDEVTRNNFGQLSIQINWKRRHPTSVPICTVISQARAHHGSNSPSLYQTNGHTSRCFKHSNQCALVCSDSVSVGVGTGISRFAGFVTRKVQVGLGL